MMKIYISHLLLSLDVVTARKNTSLLEADELQLLYATRNPLQLPNNLTKQTEERVLGRNLLDDQQPDFWQSWSQQHYNSFIIHNTYTVARTGSVKEESWRCNNIWQEVYNVIACEQTLLFGQAKRVWRERASERRSFEGQRKGELATISNKLSFVFRPDKGKYHRLLSSASRASTFTISSQMESLLAGQ